jgi:hypothetical protein
LEKSKDVVKGEDKVQKFTGLEFWFTPRSPYRAKHEANDNEDTNPPVNVPPLQNGDNPCWHYFRAAMHPASSDRTVDRNSSLTIERSFRCNHHGASYDILDNTICPKVIEALVI